MTHDYKRNGTTLFAALNILDGSVIGRNMQPHRYQEFIRVLNAIEAESPLTKPSTLSWIIAPLKSSSRFAPGSPAIRAGPSTSHRLRAHGSTPSRASLPSSPGEG